MINYKTEYSQHLDTRLTVNSVIGLPFSDGLLQCRTEPASDITGTPGTPAKWQKYILMDQSLTSRIKNFMDKKAKMIL